MKQLMILLLLSTSVGTLAEEADNEESAAQQPPQAQETQTDNLQNPDLGEAFEQFQPSEEISADNAVPFPVDI